MASCTPPLSTKLKPYSFDPMHDADTASDKTIAITYPTLSTTSAPTSTTASRRSLLQQQDNLRNGVFAGMSCEVVLPPQVLPDGRPRVCTYIARHADGTYACNACIRLLVRELSHDTRACGAAGCILVF
jgi:hypothetical protein